MKIKVNGKEEEINGSLTIQAYLQTRGINAKTVVVEYNYQIPEKEKWDTILLEENDNLEILKFIGGG